MSDAKRYIEEREKIDPEFTEGYEQLKIGVLLRLEREKAGLTRDQLAAKLNTNSLIVCVMPANSDQQNHLKTLQVHI